MVPDTLGDIASNCLGLSDFLVFWVIQNILKDILGIVLFYISYKPQKPIKVLSFLYSKIVFQPLYDKVYVVEQ